MSVASFAVQFNEIMEANYDISDINTFAETYSKCLDLSLDEILSYFKIMESLSDYPVDKDMLVKYYSKPLSIKNLQKTFNIQDYEFDNEDNMNFSYSFFKRFLGMTNERKFSSMQKIEYIISVDMMKKTMKLSNVVQKPKNIFLGMILKSTDSNIVKLEYVKIKKSKMSEMSSVVDNKEIVMQFTYDKDIDNIKLFGDKIKHLFSEKVDIMDRKKEREVDSKNIKIKESLDSLDKEERKIKEKDMLVKHVKLSMKSLGIQIKSTFITYPLEESFSEKEILDIIDSNASEYSSLEIIKKCDNIINDIEEKKENNLIEEEKEESDSDSDDDQFGL